MWLYLVLDLVHSANHVEGDDVNGVLRDEELVRGGVDLLPGKVPGADADTASQVRR